MKKIILLASAGILALSSVAVTAQTRQPAPGASTQDNMGSNSGSMNGSTTTGNAAMRDKGGNSMGSTPSGAGPNTNNMESQAGGGGSGGGAGGAGGGAGGAGGGGR